MGKIKRKEKEEHRTAVDNAEEEKPKKTRKIMKQKNKSENK